MYLAMESAAVLAASTGGPSVFIIAALIGGGVGAAIGSTKDRTALGLVLGLILGCLGWIIIALIPRK